MSSMEYKLNPDQKILNMLFQNSLTSHGILLFSMNSGECGPYLENIQEKIQSSPMELKFTENVQQA